MNDPIPLLGANALLERWYKSVDAMIDARRNSIAMIVRMAPGGRVEGFGTALFFSKSGWPFIVTAGHVLQDAITSVQRGQGAFLVTRGRKELIDLSKTEFFHQSELDIAVAPLWKRPASEYSHVTFFEDNDVCRSVAIDQPSAFTGFPASRNKTYASREMRPHQRIITFAAQSTESDSDPFPFVHFPVKRDDLHTSDFRSAEMAFPEGLHGMSGGPVFQVGGTVLEPILAVCAVGIAWAREREHLKALRFDLIDTWLSQHLTW